MTSLPLWLQIVALVGGLIWPFYQLYLALSGPKLDVRLTKDLFFRFIEMGECLFIRLVLIAEHGNVLITNIEANLARIDSGGSKEWELEFLKFGEVMADNKNVEPSFCFHSSSPFRYLSKGLPVQAVYLARPKHYGVEYSEIINELKVKLIPIRSKVARVTSDAENSNQGKLDGEYAEINELSEKYAQRLADKIQLEAGNYKINLKITYRSIRGLGSYFSRHASASILSFQIEKNARDQIKSALPSAVQRAALNMVFNANLPVGYPEYAPINIQEDAKV